jgi:hypothetical protein
MQRDSTVIWEDNRSTILIAENECRSTGRSKHIDIRYKFVAQTIADNIVRVCYTPTDTNLADILTKALPRATFERLRVLCQGNKLGNYYVDATLEHERVMCMCDSNTWMTTSVYSHGRCYLISIQSDEGGVLKYSDDEINREIFRTQA